VKFYHFLLFIFRVMTPPKNLTEMISFVEIRNRIVLEYDNKAKEFKLISDNVKVLGMYTNYDLNVIINGNYHT